MVVDKQMAAAPGRPASWRGPLREVDRLEWSAGAGAPALGPLLAGFLGEHPAAGVALLLGAAACAGLAGLPAGRCSPVPAVPDAVAVAYRRGEGPLTAPAARPGDSRVGEWTPSWTDEQHAQAVRAVQSRIAAGEVYQANVVGHRSARHGCRPEDLAARVAELTAAPYRGVLSGEGWAVGSASPEQLVRVRGRQVSTSPIKGTVRAAPGARRWLLASEKDRAEHVMIVDLARNDLSRIATTGSVAVERLYRLSRWAGLWHAVSTVTAQLADGVGALEVLAAVAPGGSVTGAPKRSACALLAGLEPVGRGPAMGAFGFLWPGGLDLGLTIRTVAADADRVHLWAGGGITWSSDPAAEVAEAHAKAAPLVAGLSSAGGSAPRR